MTMMTIIMTKWHKNDKNEMIMIKMTYKCYNNVINDENESDGNNNDNNDTRYDMNNDKNNIIMI